MTALSCKIIVNNLEFLQGVDIRGNRVGDEGIEIIARGLPKLKNLLISETGATDRGGQMVADSFPGL